MIGIFRYCYWLIALKLIVVEHHINKAYLYWLGQYLKAPIIVLVYLVIADITFVGCHCINCGCF